MRCPSHSARRCGVLAVLILATLASSCSIARRAEQGRRGFEQSGIASWYGPGFHGRTTANGEAYDMEALTAAHKKIPFGSIVEVKNRDNGRKTQVRINDRGPFVRGRIIDLSKAAAREIGMLGPGTARVKIRVVGRDRWRAKPRHPRTAAAGRYFVQVGAFGALDRAEARLAAVREQAPGARIESSRGLYRVVIPDLSKPDAESTAAALERFGFETLIKAVG